ncbi:MAG: nucleotidyltransferase domain-containing protein [Bacteroidetes bacterium]|jgi:predicted nucleotidyltransferase|nr:nucleotidyltransferase domain-containing protein [Bacteroidota bacterium]MBT6686420.1 nucleotidyltransferase domain-containing protein [Bacteroidota bacterium]MBT7142253.1 nucleotidyltransferase domain-containing protein [Bacteroidota bacterium]MBT7491603.1 nucleotidyltransferase domain-containing protein [Bacteroidota bacterium]
MITKKQINVLAESIANKFDAKKIFLFGSFAYGELQARSDLDFCIITDLGKKRKIELIRDIRREISQISQKPIDILL